MIVRAASRLAAGLAVAALLALPFAVRASGWRWVTVESGSMAPGIPVGAVVLVRPAGPADVGPGDVVAYVDHTDERRNILHRITGRMGEGEGLAFETRGDANPGPDFYPVPAALVFGRLAGSAPPAWLVLAPSALVTVGALGALAADARRRRRDAPVHEGPGRSLGAWACTGSAGSSCAPGSWGRRTASSAS